MPSLLVLRVQEELNDHKVTLGIKVDRVPRALEFLGERFKSGGVLAKLIVSGTGDWRYLDIVSNGAGKHEALEYVRSVRPRSLLLIRSRTWTEAGWSGRSRLLQGEARVPARPDRCLRGQRQ